MNFSFSEEHNLIRETAKGFLAVSSSNTAVREWMETDKGYEDAFWQTLACEMGWAMLAIPEEYDGLGMGYVELAIIMEEMGHRLTGSPLFATICQGAQALIQGGTGRQKAELLPEIAMGTKTATLAFGANGSFGIDDITFEWMPTETGYNLTGKASQVIDGASADIIIVAARHKVSREVKMFIVDQSAVTSTNLKTMDQTRRMASVEMEDISVGKDAILEGGYDEFVKVCNISSIMLAAEQLGVARWCLDASVTYSLDRVQFGRAIGSFQSIKHKCSDMMVLVESGISCVYYAACVIDAGTDELAEAAPTAKATLTSSAMTCAGECIQIHGGIGITWEADAHLYFKRARAGEQLLGSPTWHREQMAVAMGL